MRLELKVEGIDALLTLLQGGKIQEAAAEAVTESTALILNRIRTNFLDQVDPDGRDWEPSYAAFKRSFFGRGGGTLFDTGNLFHSIQLHSVSPLEGAIGTDVPYAPYHQFGTKTLPQRMFLGFSEVDEDLALKVLIKKIEEAFK